MRPTSARVISTRLSIARTCISARTGPSPVCPSRLGGSSGLAWWRSWRLSPSQTRTSPAGTYLFLLGTVGLAVILYLAYASYQLQTACVLCLGTYAAVAGIFIVSGSASSVPMTQIPARLASDLAAAVRRPAVTAFLLFLVAGTVSVAANFPKEGSRPQATRRQAHGASVSGFRDRLVAAAESRSWHPRRRREGRHRQVQ